MKILSCTQMRAAEKSCEEHGITAAALMENAGRAVAEEARCLVGSPPALAVILVGPGNNGGDGEVAARYLLGWGHRVVLYLASGRPEGDSNLVLATEAGARVVDAREDGALSLLDQAMHSASIVIDAIYGTGFRVTSTHTRRLSRSVAAALRLVAHWRRGSDVRNDGRRIVAVDLPSGADADTGQADKECLYADLTVVLGLPKPGLFVGELSERAGRLSLVDIGIPDGFVGEGIGDLMTLDLIQPLLPRRPLVSNKGTFGKVMVVAGSSRFAGAAYLACSGAARSGAGLVTLAASMSLASGISSRPVEATLLPLPEQSDVSQQTPSSVIKDQLDGYDSLLIGPGLGRGSSVVGLIKSLLLGTKRPGMGCVIDADGLAAISELNAGSSVWERLGRDIVITPHPGEMSMLCGMSVDAIQRDRINIAATMASRWKKTVVLKGAYTVVASQDGRIVVSPFANPALASAGTGDVLAGVIAGLMAQGLLPFEAAVAGVFVHGKAAELVSRRLGDAGILASDLLPELPSAIRDIKAA